MQLSIAERILLLNVLPQAEGPFLFLRAVRKLREDLGFSEQETVDLSLKALPDRVTWDKEKNPMKEIEIGPVVARYISDSIIKAPSLQEAHMEFYARFVKEGE